MELIISIKMDNAAFDGCRGFEAARILRELADKIEDDPLSELSLPVRDYNGNRVGRAIVREYKSNRAGRAEVDSGEEE